jgi:hypothetical protein
MKLPILLVATALAATAAQPAWFIDPALQARIGFDSNPVGAGGATATALGDRGTLTESAGASFALALPVNAFSWLSARLAYAGEATHFDRWHDEDFTTHRLALAGKLELADWTLSADASTLFVDGSRDTLPSLAGSNAHATTIWRERRAQWQHRARLLAQREIGPLALRCHGSLLDYDFLTHDLAGRVPFVDRADAFAGADAGWKTSAGSLTFAGVRLGRQFQDQASLPGCEFDYSSRYTRVIAGWEGRLGPATLAFAAGPDFRHYDGAVDPRVFAGRDRTALWFDGNASVPLGSRCKLTAKAARWTWLSSTGKSAYIDFSAETALAVSLSTRDALRLTFRAHQLNYDPVARNDWESQGIVGLTHNVTKALAVSADVSLHRGWNALGDVPDRAFSRTIASAGVAWKF